jgi:hypothetical protein
LKSGNNFDGVDLMAIEGVSHATLMAIMSGVGLEGFGKFETSKQFSSWLHLSPNTEIPGGKPISSHIPKGGSRLKIALRNAANVIGNLKNTHLSDFFKRILYKTDPGISNKRHGTKTRRNHLEHDYKKRTLQTTNRIFTSRPKKKA